MPVRIVVVGGGFAGVRVVQELVRQARPDELDVTLVAPTGSLLYFPLLPEVVSGSLQPRHVLVGLHGLVPGARLVQGEAIALDRTARQLTVRPTGGLPAPESVPVRLGYDHLVLALGAEGAVPSAPGAAGQALALRSAEDATRLRARALDVLVEAARTEDPARRQELLTFVVVGGGSTGVEVLGELEALVRDLAPAHGLPRHAPAFHLVELGGTLIAEVGPQLGAYAADRLRARGVRVHLGVSVVQALPDRIVLSDDTVLPARTLVWTAGLRAPGALARFDLPRDAKGYLLADGTLALPGAAGYWALGDCAHVPDAAGRPYPATAQHAVRQAQVLAANLLAAVRGEGPPQVYAYEPLAMLIALGAHDGVARFRERAVRGWPAWVLWRAVHLALIPRRSARWRVLFDWVLGAAFPRDEAVLRVPSPAAAPCLAGEPRLRMAWVAEEPEALGRLRTGSQTVVEAWRPGRERG